MKGEIKMDMRNPYLHCKPLSMASEGTTYVALLPTGIYRTMYKDKMGICNYTEDSRTTKVAPIPTNSWLPTSLIPLENTNAED